MGSRRRSLSRVALALALMGVLVSLGVVQVAGQDGEEPCGGLTTGDLTAALTGSYSFTGGASGVCGWEGTTEAGGALAVQLFETTDMTFQDLKDQAPGGSDTTIAGLPGYLATDATTDPPSSAAAVDLDGRIVVVSVATNQSAVDMKAALTRLAETAVPRLIEAGPAEPETPAQPETATHGDPCALFSADELAAILGVAVTASGDAASCTWVSDPSSVSVAYDQGDLTFFKSIFPDGQDITVGGQPAYQYGSEAGGFDQSTVSLDLGPETISIIVSSTDPAVDAAAVAVQLAEAALAGGLEVQAEPDTAPGFRVCKRLSPEELATAAGVDVELTLVDLEAACTFYGGAGRKQISIYLAKQDAASLDVAARDLGGTEVPDLGDRSWWSKDYKTLRTRQGDVGISVTLTLGKRFKDAQLLEMARGIMTALLAPKGTP